MTDSRNTLHTFFSTAAFAVAGVLLAVLLTFLPTSQVEHHPYAVSVVIVVMPLWVVLGLFWQGFSGVDYRDLDGSLESSRGFAGINWFLILVNLAIVPVTGVALALVFGSFHQEWGWALLVGFVLAVALAARVGQMFSKM